MVAKKLTSDLINGAIQIAEDFDESIRMINDLAAQDNMGFRSWTWEVEHFNTKQKEYQRSYRTDLARALFLYQTGDKMEAVQEVLQGYLGVKRTRLRFHWKGAV